MHRMDIISVSVGANKDIGLLYTRSIFVTDYILDPPDPPTPHQIIFFLFRLRLVILEPRAFFVQYIF